MWPRVQISSRAASQIKGGSLWVFANEFQTKVKSLEPGEWVEFTTGENFVGFGYVNPHSLITGRICSRSPVKDRQAYFDELIEKAFQKRRGLEKVGSYRCVFSESDSLPGLIVDVYGKTVVVQTNTFGMDTAQEDWIQSLKKTLKPEALIVRGDSSVRHLEQAKLFNKVVIGDEKSLREGRVEENGIFFSANFVEGQKTGFFLDQRSNRGFLRAHAQGRRILDLFSYSGGWGLSALKGGAQHVSFVDQSADALKLVAKGAEMNGFETSKLQIVTDDAFDFLEKDKSQYDVVVCDPPAFIKSRKNIPQALKAYKKLNLLALARLKPGGILLSCSCSFHLSEKDLQDLLLETLQKTGRTAEVFYRGSQPADHPWILNRPESFYLKCLGLRVD